MTSMLLSSSILFGVEFREFMGKRSLTSALLINIRISIRLPRRISDVDFAGFDVDSSEWKRMIW